MSILAIALFVGLLVFGRQVLGWNDPYGKVQMALIVAFVLGYFSGFRKR